MILWQNVEIKIRTTRIIENLDLKITKGNPLGIIGHNGTGKTILAKAIAGQVPVNGDTKGSSPSLKTAFVSFQSNFQLRNGFAAFRQQRWNNIDPDSVPKVSEELEYSKYRHELDPLLQKFDFGKHLNNFVINLSNGEQRKLELIRALAQHPDLLVLDNAYNGLDVSSRILLSEMLDQMAEEKQTFVLTGLKKDDFPSSVKQFVLLQKGLTPEMTNKNSIIEDYLPASFDFEELPCWKNSPFEELILINNLSLDYGDKNILQNISWQVKAGEHWILSGANGSGKTSLLNMIFADNPKAYGCEIRLFGRSRGSGESIWDIKKKIGFISPELQQYLPKKQTSIQVICSGLFDTEGLYTKPTSYQLSLARLWLGMIGNLSWAEKHYGDLPTSAQRIVLIIRTLIKNPPLLLLDEPFQGLDSYHIHKLQSLLNLIATKTNCAIIFVSHFKVEIPRSFNQELRLDDGEIVFKGYID